MAGLHHGRDVTRLALVAAFFAVCFVMLARAIGRASPWLGLLLMFYAMGLANVAQPLVRWRLPPSLRAVDAAQVSGGVYRWLGVAAFGALLRHTPLRHLNGTVYHAGTRRTLGELSRRVEAAEAIHLWAALLFLPYMAYAWARGYVVETAVFVLVQLLVNVYPILHLRSVRARLGRLARPAAPVAPNTPPPH